MAREWYHFHAGTIGRSQRRSAVAAASYRSGERLYCEADSQVKDFSKSHRQGEIAHTEILAPEDAPDWATDREKLWNRVEAAETRKDAQLAREVRFALARELSPADRIEAARNFIRDHFTAAGMVADLAIHCDEKQHNPHAHVMLTTRELSAGGFGKKVREWNGRDKLKQWREGCAGAQNAILERVGRADAPAEHRSYQARGIHDVKPTFHVGVRATNLGRKLRREAKYNDGLKYQEPQNAHRAVSGKLDAPMPKERRLTASESHRRPRKGFERGTIQSRRKMFAAAGRSKTWHRQYDDTEGLRFFARRKQQAQRLRQARDVTKDKDLMDQFRATFVYPVAAKSNFTRYAAAKGMRAAFVRLGRKPEAYGTLRPTGLKTLIDQHRIGPRKENAGLSQDPRVKRRRYKSI